MTHDEALSLLSARLDGPLAADQQTALDAWLAESPDHPVLAEAFQTQHGELRTAFEPRREAARDTAATVVRRLPESAVPATTGGWRGRLASPLMAACAASALIGLGLIAFHRDRPPTPERRHATAAADPFGNIGLKPRARPNAPTTETVAAGQTVQTKAGEKRRVALPDGSLLYLNQSTTIEVPKDRHVRLVAGEVFVEAVSAKSDADRFLVETPKRTVTALGTKFVVTAAEAGTGVLVTQGKVEVSGLSERLTTGQELLPGRDRIGPAPRASAALDWTRDLIAAAESPLVPAGHYSGGSLVAVDPYGQEAKLSLVTYHVDVHVEDGFARTTIDQTYFNSENWRMEGTFYFPLPPDASLSRLAMYVDGDLMEGGMAERNQARDVYERIRYQNRDPALLEWVDGSVFKMRVFPLEARQEKRIVLSYTQRLPVLYGRATYRFPAGHTLALVDEWSFHAVVKNGAGMSVASPSHPAMEMQAQGQDLIADDAAKGVKIDRDVVLELTDHPAGDAPAFRWSQGELDGQKYLMVRYRPDLPTAPRRERRDWVFLFESSGARDPLVARAQVEVIRALLTHAEHDDTFSVLSVGTRVRSWSEKPLAASPENLASAMAWLESRHLIGALNLEQALADATPLLQAGPNPHLVHVGGGVASIGEQRADELVKRIPAGTRYVGIGVGKRVSPAFMKVAAERTGGLFTQVNPDEPIGWRGFEIASTLNAPRLLNVRVEAPGLNGVRFLTFSNALAHGEELAAVANVTHATPREVTIRGTLDGQPFVQVLPVSDVAAGAGYLPRTWAKLEIDRLLAADSAGNQEAITELSKAMYVMTPFTSLLVLENEQMYKDFKVDRGRKDHWALYPCPPKIPVVYIPDPNQPAGSRPDLKGQKPHANAVLQTVLTRSPPKFLTWPGHDGGDQPISTAGQRWGGAVVVNGMIDGEELAAVDFGLDGVGRGESERRKKLEDREVFYFNGPVSRLGRHLSESNVVRLMRNPGPARPAVARSKVALELQRNSRSILGVDDSSSMADSPVAFGFASRGRRRTDALGLGYGTNGRLPEVIEEDERLIASPAAAGRRRLIRQLPLGGEQVSLARMTEWRETVSNLWILNLTNEDVGFDPRLAFADSVTVGQVRAGDRESFLLGSGINSESGPVSRANASGNPPRYYGRPSFNNNYRVFTDLVAYAPGMSSSPADVRAVLEAEAAPRFGSRLGSVDPAARKLIDSARSREWKALKVGGVTFIHDGQGRYAYERRLAFGLLERVVCDGTRLWHLYPELGIGAERTVSRFHREALFDLIPDFVPPADDLARGADVKAIDANTVALVPPAPPKGQEPPASWVEERLIFLGQLSERQWVLMPQKKVLLREVYGPNGTRYLDGDGKEVHQSKRDQSPAVAPDLKPDLGKLVVLPLPLRSREHVYQELGMEPGWGLHQDRNACFAHLDADNAIRLLAAEFAANNGGNVAEVWYHCFGQKGDDRTGFFTLMAAAGYNPRAYSQITEKFETEPGDPLVRYLWEMHDDHIHAWQSRVGFGPGRGETFLGKLTAFRRVVARWTGEYIGSRFWGQRDGERQRTIDFAVRNADNVLGWCTLALVQDHCPDQAAWKAVADAWGILADRSGRRYPALYEQARCLGNAGLAELAQHKYQALFQAALKEGVLPPLDSSFRSVLQGGKEDVWAKLMRETAALCAAKKARPVIVTLAWQCYQLGDTAMADTLLGLALADVPAEEKAATHLAAVHFLSATGRHDRADQIVTELLADPKLSESADLWRLASQIADNRKDPVRAITCLERALDFEYARLPEVFDVQPIRNDYGRLLTHYEWLAEAAASLHVPPPADLLPRVVKAADRWRQLDPEAADVPNRAAAILRKAGGEAATELAWEYATTPLALKPNESGPWVSLAWSARQEGDWQLADRCYQFAFAAEPTNAQLLWDRAEHLRQRGQVAESRKLLRQLADGDWQPRFSGLKAQARQAVEGR